jgi:tRNA dimethylallyltransferase
MIRNLAGSMRTQRDIVAVIGTTGSGKSQLAIDLATAVKTVQFPQSIGVPVEYKDAEILSADSMQLYRGLPLITNQVSREEMQGIKHWGIDIVQPGEGGPWEVGRWCNEAVSKVSLAIVASIYVPIFDHSCLVKIDTLPAHTLPIVCGGTHYYSQHFLFPPAELSLDRTELATTNETKTHNTKWKRPCSTAQLDKAGLLGPGVSQKLRKSLEALDFPYNERSEHLNSETLLEYYRLLEELDPIEARRWHWRDGRKVRRAIERWWETQAATIEYRRNEAGSSQGPSASSRDDGRAR